MVRRARRSRAAAIKRVVRRERWKEETEGANNVERKRREEKEDR
jgi:hypothetical protein